MTTREATPRWLLVSDIDDTLTGDPAALAELGQVLAAQRGRLSVAVNSSRPLASVDRTLLGFPGGFPLDAAITAMGTEITLRGRPLPGWAERFAGWPGGRVFQTVARLGYRPHADEFQTPLKVSFAVPRADWPRVTAALQDAALPCRIVTSGDSDLDILPPAAGKDEAALALAAALGVPRTRLVVAGDSGNDLAMFRIAAHAIAVGNARRELLAAMPLETSYHASLPHAAGVREGLAHFGLLAG